MSLLGKTTFVLLLVGLAWGCATQKAVRLANSPSRSFQQVALLPGPPDRPFKVVGHITLSGKPDTSESSVTMQLREQAAAMGADAVFLGDADDYPVGAVVNLPETLRNSRAGAMGDLPGKASWQPLLWLVRAPHAKTTPLTDPSSPRSTGIAIVYQ